MARRPLEPSRRQSVVEIPWLHGQMSYPAGRVASTRRTPRAEARERHDETPHTTRPGTAAKVIYGVVGWCAVALAIAGALLPGLPSTVFVLIASYCFSRSSPRFERWLRDHRWFGPVLRRFARDGGMPRSAKRAALTAMWTAILVSAAVLVSAHGALALATVASGAIGTLTILYGVRTVSERPSEPLP